MKSESKYGPTTQRTRNRILNYLEETKDPILIQCQKIDEMLSEYIVRILPPHMIEAIKKGQ